MADHPSPVAGELNQARDLCALPDPEQLELIRDQVPGRDARTAVAIAERRGRGRPPGSRNRQNQKFREQLLALSGGVHPGLVLARTYAMPVETLAATLECTRAEAYAFQMRAAAELMPYFEGKQPVQVDIRQRSDVVLVMAGGNQVDGGTLEAIAEEANDGIAGGVDWETAEILDVLPSLGEPSQDVSSSSSP